MKKISTIFLQAVVVLIGIVALIVLIRFPLTEGRAVNLDLLSIYSDPFIIYGYLVSIAFFTALYQAFKLLSYIGQNKIFSLNSFKALKTIKYCAIILSLSIVMAVLFIITSHHPDDDPAGFIAMGIITTFITLVVATTANVFERTLQQAMDIKSKNDLIYKIKFMKQAPTLFLKFVISLIGIIVLASCSAFTWQLITTREMLFLPILIILWLTAIPFFLALYQAIKLLGYIDRNIAFSELSLQALKKIKYFAITISAIYVAGMPFLFYVADQDDAPGAVGFGIIFIFASIVIATFATVLQKLVQSGLAMKSENDLTI
jgi:hypothetical protein